MTVQSLTKGRFRAAVSYVRAKSNTMKATPGGNSSCSEGRKVGPIDRPRLNMVVFVSKIGCVYLCAFASSWEDEGPALTPLIFAERLAVAQILAFLEHQPL